MPSRRRTSRPTPRTAATGEHSLVSFSVYQFARRHGVTPPTIYGEIYRGLLPAMRIGRGGVLRITCEHEAEWMRRRAYAAGVATANV
jgi:hypothetical protein